MEALKINCTLTALFPPSVAPDAERNKEVAPLAHRICMLVLRRTQIDWRIVKHITAPYLMNNAAATQKRALNCTLTSLDQFKAIAGDSLSAEDAERLIVYM